jgi:hypothetical protein
MHRKIKVFLLERGTSGGMRRGRDLISISKIDLTSNDKSTIIVNIIYKIIK